MNRQAPQQFLNANILTEKQSWRAKTLGKYRTEEDSFGMKHECGYGNKNHTKTKRPFKNSVVRYGRADHGVVSKALDKLHPATLILPSNRDCQYTRHIPFNHGSYRHVFQASRRMVEENKKDRKQSAVGSLTSILGSEKESDKLDLPSEPDNDVHSTPERKSMDIGSAHGDLDIPISRKRRTSLLSSLASSKRREEKNKKNKKDRKQCVIGSLTSILGVDNGSLTVSDDDSLMDFGKKSKKDLMDSGKKSKNALLDSGKKSKNALLDSGKKSKKTKVDFVGSPPDNRKRQTMLHIARVSNCRDEKKNDRKQSVNGSLTSILGSEEESYVTPNGGLCLNSGTRLIDIDVVPVATISGTSSPITRKRRTTKLGSAEDDQIVKNKNKFHLNETNVREHIRAKLRQNQHKYSALAATLASTKAKTASNQITSTLPATRTLMAKSHFYPSTTTTATTTQSPKLRSRARNGRLYSVCKRIPASIPENDILDMNNSRGTKNTASKGKASFYPRSPKKAKASFYPRSPTRNRRRFRVIAPHPTESVGPCKAKFHGGLCMTFPTKNNRGAKIKEARNKNPSTGK